MHAKYGIVLPADAENFLHSRLVGYIRRTGHASINALIREIHDGRRDDLLLEVVEQLSTNHSYFYREPAHFEFFVSTALPDIRERITRQGRPGIRIWSAAAAAGEEAYSIVMAMRSYFGRQYEGLDAGVLATDISTRALKRGMVGEYREEAFRYVPPDWRRQFLEPAADNRLRIAKSVRDDVMFRWLNLVEPLSVLRRGFHVVFCRNVMIYFDNETCDKLIRSLTELLVPGGYLFIGHTDNSEAARRYLDQLQPAIFRKRAGP